MGTCISKCMIPNNDPSPPNSSPPQDKLVISQSSNSSHPISLDFSNHEHKPSSWQTSSSSSSVINSCCSSKSFPSTSNCTTTSTTTTCSSSYFSPSPGDVTRNNELLSKPRPVNFQAQMVRRPVRRSPGKLSGKDACVSQPKRTRSSSPPVMARQKSFKTEHSSVAKPSVRALKQTSVAKSSPKRVELSGNGGSHSISLRKERLRTSNSLNTLTRQRPAGILKETPMLQIQSHMVQNGNGALLSKESSKVSLMEDIDNPLISMDCFIFL